MSAGDYCEGILMHRTTAIVRTGLLFYGKAMREAWLEWLFDHRKNIVIPGVESQLRIQTKQIEHHPDFPRFVQYVMEDLPSGEWLFKPSVWDKK
jgi:hypothetical protein